MWSHSASPIKVRAFNVDSQHSETNRSHEHTVGVLSGTVRQKSLILSLIFQVLTLTCSSTSFHSRSLKNWLSTVCIPSTPGPPRRLGRSRARLQSRYPSIFIFLAPVGLSKMHCPSKYINPNQANQHHSKFYRKKEKSRNRHDQERTRSGTDTIRNRHGKDMDRT